VDDSVDQLWAPWRLSYAATPKAPGGDDCFICRVGAAPTRDDRENLVAYRTERALVVLNRYPYNNGHLLVCPQAHKANLGDLDDAELLDLQHLLCRMMTALRSAIKPDGFNVGLNLGRVAGAGVPGHLHWHIVPRWNGDTNFMPVIGETKVIVQALDALYDVLSHELSKHDE
jgi:ATP adenylyltransferase